MGGTALDLAWVHSAQVNKSAVERRAAEIGTRRSIKKTHQLAWLVRALQCIDLTTLAGDDTDCNVSRLCAKARSPVHGKTLDALGIAGEGITVGAVCVYPNMVKKAVACLQGSGIPVASVATGFPAGMTPLSTRLEEIRLAVADGAGEIDIVINRPMVLMQQWEALYDEVKQMKQACGKAHLKTILATGELPTYKHVYQASIVCMMAGADFIKTSTGKEGVNATLPVSLVMVRAIRDYQDRTGVKVGYKPAGGIRSAKQTLQYLALMMEELGEEWTHNDLFRFGASSLLGDIERQLYHGAFGRYHAKQYIPMA